MPRMTIVMKSTVPVGTGEKVRAALDARGLEAVGYVSNPEFTAEGTAVRDFLEPDRIVIGAFDEEDGDAVAALHAGIDAPVVRADVNSAEMIKLAANAFLVTRISFINEIANVCELVGADVKHVAEGIGLDHRLGPHFLRAGIGWGGSCFPKDSLALKQLAANSGYHFHLMNAVIEVNELQKRRVLQKLQRHLGGLRGKSVALLGLAFKPNTDDMREAPSLVLASRLLAEGAEVRGWDPVARPDLAGSHAQRHAARGRRRRRRGRDRHRVAAAARVPQRGDSAGDAASADRRRAQPPRPRRRARARVRLRGDGPPDLGDRRPAGGRRAASWRRASSGSASACRRQGGAAGRGGAGTAEAARARRRSCRSRRMRLARLVESGVTRVIVACRAGDEDAFLAALSGLGAEVEAVGEDEPLGRGGGLRLAATRRQEEGPVLALNGDELLDVDFRALLSEHEASGAAGTIVVAQVRSPFGVVEVEEDGTITGFREAPLLEHWVNSGVYVLGEEALALLPEKGDHEQSTFPQLAGERRLHAHRHEGVWLTVNTPKDLRRAAEFIEAHPEWRPQGQLA